MTVTVSQQINAPRERVWKIITDFDIWADTISGILKVEVIEKPEDGIVGLKWKETREMFGKEAIETMWISAAEANNWYETTAHNHGMIYSTRVSIEDAGDGVVLTMSFSGKPTTLMARLMSVIGMMFSGTLRKMLQKDLADIRAAAESA